MKRILAILLLAAACSSQGNAAEDKQMSAAECIRAVETEVSAAKAAIAAQTPEDSHIQAATEIVNNCIYELNAQHFSYMTARIGAVESYKQCMETYRERQAKPASAGQESSSGTTETVGAEAC